MSLQALADLRAFNRAAPGHKDLSRLFETVNEPGRAVVVASALGELGHTVALRTYRLTFAHAQRTLQHVVWAFVMPTTRAPMWLGMDGTIGMHEIVQGAQPDGYARHRPVKEDEWDEVPDLLDLAHQLSKLQLSSDPNAPDPLQLDPLVEHAVSIMQAARLDRDTQEETSHAAPRRL